MDTQDGVKRQPYKNPDTDELNQMLEHYGYTPTRGARRALKRALQKKLKREMRAQRGHNGSS